MASVDGRTNDAKITNVVIEAAIARRSDICQMILSSRRLPVQVIVAVLKVACIKGHVSVAQLAVCQGRLDKQDLVQGLTYKLCTRSSCDNEVVTERDESLAR
jgi:hypothetical protein